LIEWLEIASLRVELEYMVHIFTKKHVPRTYSYYCMAMERLLGGSG
jgi:hypothetical protein